MVYKKRKTKIEFIFEPLLLMQKAYIRSVHLNVQRLTKLFPVAPSLIVVHFFRNRTLFLKAIHKKNMPNWLIAYVPSRSVSGIYVLNDKNKLTTKKVMSQILLHEITHLYTNTLNPNLPDWLKEGISVYIASQTSKLSISIADWEKIAPKGIPFKSVSWKIAAEHNGYNIAGMLVMFFIKRYGWKNFIMAISCRHSIHFSIKSIPLHFGDKFEGFMSDFKKQFVK